MKWQNNKGEIIEYTSQEIEDFIKNMPDSFTIKIPPIDDDSHYFLIEDEEHKDTDT